MIHFNFLIKNPYSSIKWDNIYSRDFKISKNKSIDISLDQDETIIHLGFNIRVKEDHSGFGLVIGLLSYTASFNFYDNRHYNDPYLDI